MPAMEKVGSVSAASVIRHTKKNWDEWILALNKRGCQQCSHQELVQILKKEFKLNIWWQQEVARGYQIAIGVRIPQQTLKGTYTTTATKSIIISPKKLWTFLTSAEGQELWLRPLSETKIKKDAQFECEGGVFGEFRTVTASKKLRMTWINEDWSRKTVVQLHLYPKPKGKCMMVFDHIDLPSLAAKNEMHTRWRKAVDDIAQAFEQN